MPHFLIEHLDGSHPKLQNQIGWNQKAVWNTNCIKDLNFMAIAIFVNLRFFWHFETVTNIRTWIKSHRYWRML